MVASAGVGQRGASIENGVEPTWTRVVAWPLVEAGVTGLSPLNLPATATLAF
jgi:hypothetical protein